MLQATCRIFPLIKPSTCSPLRPFSSSTPYPLYYDLIHYSPHRRQPRRRPPSATATPAATSGDPEPSSDHRPLDRAKRRYYRKRQQRLYGGSGSDSDSGRPSDFVELKPEIVEFPRLHAREQELFFHDAFALPWERDKHYRMVHQLESKFFPDHSLDKAFVGPREGEGCDDRGLVFFDEEGEKGEGRRAEEKKVEEFFRGLKKAPNAPRSGRDGVDGGEEDGGCRPFLSRRGTGFPAKWDGPAGTVVLVDKPKGL